MSKNKKTQDETMSPTYELGTLLIAAALFIGFCLLLFFLPQIMLAIGGGNAWMSGAVIAAVLMVPFIGLWLRGKIRSRDSQN